jgi:succinoglycan biosynthesis protein ExoO
LFWAALHGFEAKRTRTILIEDRVRKPDVSVIVAAYNAAAFIDRALTSALGQQGVALEVIVIDDCSKDATIAVVEGWAARDERVRLVASPENQGPAASRNLGIAAAGGRWIAVLDADDAFGDGRLAHLISLAEARGAQMIVDNFYFYDAKADRLDGLGLALSPQTEVLSQAGFVKGACPFNAESDYGLLKPVFLKAFAEAHGVRYDTRQRHGEDFRFAFDLLQAGATCLLVREPFYLYTKRDAGLSRTNVDDRSLINSTADLAARENVKRDPVLAALFRRRISRLRTLGAARKLEPHMAQRNYAGALGVLVANPRILPVFGARLLRKLFGSKRVEG